ncbi:MAG: hypothetical protein WBV39_08505 [Rudaea sp.]
MFVATGYSTNEFAAVEIEVIMTTLWEMAKAIRKEEASRFASQAAQSWTHDRHGAGVGEEAVGNRRDGSTLRICAVPERESSAGDAV